MNLDDYQKEAFTTAVYPTWEKQLILTTLGLNGEAGEVAEKVKKLIRDSETQVSESLRQDIKKELGDVLWYLSVLALTFDLKLSDVATSNLEKLRSRKERGMIKGSGDER